MKKIFKTIAIACIALATFTSCDKKDAKDYLYGKATCTLKPLADGTYYMKVDEQTAFVNLNTPMNKYPWKDTRERRAYITYMMDPADKVDPVPGFEKTQGVYVEFFDTLVVKNPVVFNAENDDKYGKDPIGLIVDKNAFPRTCVEDGYLSVSMSIPFASEYGALHDINIVYGQNAEDPYELELRHNAHGNLGPYAITQICDFRLKDLPSTEGKTVKLTLKWNSMVSGKQESIQFDYCSREDW